MKPRIIRSLAANDLRLHSRDIVSIMNMAGFVIFIAIYFIMPASVNESFEVGLYAPEMPGFLPDQMGNEGLKVKILDSEAHLKQAVAEKELPVGVMLPQALVNGSEITGKPIIKIYFSTDFPGEFKESFAVIIRELMYTMNGRQLNIEDNFKILGPDMTGKQVPLKKRMLPLFAVVILIMEILGLANLLTYEFENKTIFALLVTPVKMGHLYTAKTITGTGIAFIQVVLFMAVTGGLGRHALLVTITLFLGTLMVTGIAFLVASVSKDLMSVIAWGFIGIIALCIPAFAVILPGALSGWIKIFPTYYLVDTINRAVNYNTGWAGNWQNLLVILGFDLFFFLLGIKAFSRRIK